MGAFTLQGVEEMTKKEKQLLRVAVAIIQNAIIRDNKKKSQYLYECVRKHPENYDIEFITEMGFSKEQKKRLLKLRSERLKK